MARDRETVCTYYICAGECEKGRKADHYHYCQKCDKYRPRAHEKHINRKKKELEKIKNKEWKEEI